MVPNRYDWECGALVIRCYSNVGHVDVLGVSSWQLMYGDLLVNCNCGELEAVATWP